MKQFSRRDLIPLAGIAAISVSAQQHTQAPRQSIPIDEYEPKSTLHTQETTVERARFPVIDVHTHISFSAKSKGGVSIGAERRYLAPPRELLEVMDRRNLKAMVNLTGGFGKGLEDCVQKYDRAFPGRFYTCTEPSYNLFLDPNYPALQAKAIGEAHSAGARGLKILKTLGLFLRENLDTGQLVKIDDPRFDPMWDACGQLKMPVSIHISDPVAFFSPIDKYNERYEELHHHPDWSFHGRDFPSNDELLAARNRVIERHPHTQFIVLHVGNYAENLDHVAQCLDRYPNMSVEIAARIGELGRQPRAARRFFERYQDRIMFGTDAVPHGNETPQQVFGDLLYQIYFRFLETDDEYFDYAPARIPPQGRWRIYGIQLPDTILRKVYNQNAARVLGIEIGG